ncbi:MAG: hypothetical protein KatS3mg031_1765 [Chitinophagales bacterium]|nr:MAG: hypothetical protein KatS3mg031_1765 [Chitinophagales bacterium]
MNTSAIILMIIVQGTVSLITFYLYMRVLTSQQRTTDKDSSGNGDSGN